MAVRPEDILFGIANSDLRWNKIIDVIAVEIDGWLGEEDLIVGFIQTVYVNVVHTSEVDIIFFVPLSAVCRASAMERDLMPGDDSVSASVRAVIV